VRLLVAALRARPGRGGVRLTYAQAELALRMIAYGGYAARELRRRKRGLDG
jgi:hypothetical protein